MFDDLGFEVSKNGKTRDSIRSNIYMSAIAGIRVAIVSKNVGKYVLVVNDTT